MDCPAIRPQQLASEFFEFARLVKEQQSRYLLEIVTYRVTFFLYLCKSPLWMLLSSALIYLWHFSAISIAPVKIRFFKLTCKGLSLFLLRKAFHKPDDMDSIHKVLLENKLGFLFIYRDHSYESVCEDFAMYPLVARGMLGCISWHYTMRISEESLQVTERG